MRLVLDTNVVASALLWGGPPRLLLQAGRDKRVELFTSTALLAELTNILGRRKFDGKILASTLTVDQLVDRYAVLAALVRPTPTPRVAPDPDDDVVVGTALAAQADLIVTGDKALLSVTAYREVRIVGVAQAVQIVGIARPPAPAFRHHVAPMMTTTAPSPHPRHWRVLVLLFAATWLTAALGAFASVDAKLFYRGLAQPAWAPPAAVFGPVWTVLFGMMCVAAWLVVRRLGVAAARPALGWYGAQLAANALWNWLFFRWHAGAAASVEVLVLLALVALTLRSFWRARSLAGWLMLPYLAWVGFASALTVAIWRLNPAVL